MSSTSSSLRSLICSSSIMALLVFLSTKGFFLLRLGTGEKGLVAFCCLGADCFLILGRVERIVRTEAWEEVSGISVRGKGRWEGMEYVSCTRLFRGESSGC